MASEYQFLYYEQIDVNFEWKSSGRTITETDVTNFACLSGDFNPIHVDQEFSKQGMFGERIAHGLLGLSVASGLLTSVKPWAVTAFMGLDWKFSKPIFIGDTVHYSSKVKSKKDMGSSSSGIVKMERKLINQKDEVVQTGNWTLMVQKESAL